MKPIVSPNIRVRYPEHFSVGEGSIVDDFSYFSTRVVIGRYSHIASSCTIAGGIAHQFTFGDYGSLSAGVRIWCSSNDYVNDLVMITPPGVDLGDHQIAGDVTLENYTGVGANSVIMPGVLVPEGTVVGAMSFVPARAVLQPWSVYAGVPARLVRSRNRDNVLRQVERMDSVLKRGT